MYLRRQLLHLLFTGQNTSNLSGLFGEILMYLEYDLISIAVISGYEDYVI